MSKNVLSAADLDPLRRYDTPTVCNVVELFDARPRHAGYTNARIQACYPKLPPMVGYASIVPTTWPRRPSWHAPWTPRSWTPWPVVWPRCATAAGACSSSASAVAPATPRTRSTTSASSAASRATRRPTTSPSSPRAPTTMAGRRRSARGSRSRGCPSATRCSSSPSAAARASTTSRPTSSARWRPRASVGASIYGVVGAPGGTLAELADVAILIEPPPDLRTPLVESFQAVVWHALVSHPELAAQQGHWESLAASRSRERPLVGLARARPADLTSRRAGATAAGARRIPRPGRRAQRGGARSRLRRCSSRRLRSRTCACSRASPRRRGALRGRGLRARVRLQPAGGGEGQDHGRRSCSRSTSGCSSCWRARACSLDASRLCPHHPDGVVAELSGRCDCRKPAPGMLLDAAARARARPRRLVDARRHRH